MTMFAVLLHGQSLKLLNQDGNLTTGGAYTWRVVEARDSHEAGELARVKLLSDQHFLSEIWNASDESPDIAVDEISELESADAADTACVYYFSNENDYPYGTLPPRDEEE